MSRPACTFIGSDLLLLMLLLHSCCRSSKFPVCVVLYFILCVTVRYHTTLLLQYDSITMISYRSYVFPVGAYTAASVETIVVSGAIASCCSCTYWVNPQKNKALNPKPQKSKALPSLFYLYFGGPFEALGLLRDFHFRWLLVTRSLGKIFRGVGVLGV